MPTSQEHRQPNRKSYAVLHPLDTEDDPLTATQAVAEGPRQAVPRLSDPRRRLS